MSSLRTYSADKAAIATLATGVEGRSPCRRMRNRLLATAGGRRVFGFAWAVVLLGLFAAAPAESATLMAQRYSTQDGLSQSTIVSLGQDQNGFLWVGTQEGLHRFDGHRFSVIETGGEYGVVSSTFDDLLVDDRNRIWLGSSESGVEVIHLASLERHKISVAEGLLHPRVTAMAQDRSGDRVLVTTAGGVSAINAQHLTVSTLLEAPNLIASVADSSGNWWAANRECALWRNGEPFTIEASAGGGGCLALLADGAGVWLIASNGDIRRLGPDGTMRYELGASLPAGVTAAHLDQPGQLMLGLANGQIGRVTHAGRWLSMDVELGGSAITRMFRDRLGVLWVGTFADGLNRVQPLSEQLMLADFRSEDGKERWPSRVVWSIFNDGSNWLIGTQRGLLRGSDAENATSVTAFSGIAVRSILADRDGAGVWLGTHQGIWRWRPPAQPQRLWSGQLPDPRITDMAWVGDRLWVATRGGLAIASGDQLLPEQVPAMLRQRFLTTLLADDDQVWVGSNESGVFRVDATGQAGHFFKGDESRETTSVWSLLAGDDGLWVGTFGGGLLHVDAGGHVTETLTMADGLPNDVIYRMLRDPDGRIWLSTNRGLAVIDEQRGNVQPIVQADGLINREFNAGAAWQGQQGRLYFGGLDGVDGLRTQALPPVSSPATPVLADLTIAHQSVGVLAPFEGMQGALSFAERLTLSPRQRVFSLRMVALNFHSPDAARLRYRLEGLDQAWREPSGPVADFSINYLAPGRYRLLVEAAGRDGEFVRQRSLELVLLPPFWRSTPAFILYGLITLLIAAVGIWRFRVAVSRKRQQVAELNRLVGERTRDLESLNETLAIKNRHLDRATRRDPLTGASNRRDFHTWIDQQQVNEADLPLLFLMIDVDDFKQINDVYGHAVGDRALVAFTRCLEAFCGSDDLLVRWGGEEFLLVARGRQASKAGELAQAIVDAVSQCPVLLREQRQLRLGCSVGVAAWPFTESATSESWELSIQLADRALYAAKAAGKGGWCLLRPGPSCQSSADLGDWQPQSLDSLVVETKLVSQFGRAC